MQTNNFGKKGHIDTSEDEFNELVMIIHNNFNLDGDVKFYMEMIANVKKALKMLKTRQDPPEDVTDEYLDEIQSKAFCSETIWAFPNRIFRRTFKKARTILRHNLSVAKNNEMIPEIVEGLIKLDKDTSHIPFKYE